MMWFWRGFKGRSITFAALFASVLLGVSISKGVHRLLSALGFHWLYVVIIPVLLFRWLAQKEPDWFPDAQKRRRIAWAIIVGSLALSALIVRLAPSHPTSPP